MPFKSEKQRRFLWAAHPDIAKRWAHEYPNQKKLPMYANKQEPESKEKAAALAVLDNVLSVFANAKKTERNSILGNEIKQANSGMVQVKMPQNDKPTYAGQDSTEIQPKQDETHNSSPDGKNHSSNSVEAIFGKLAVVLAKPLREMMEAHHAGQEGRDPRFVPQNMLLKRMSMPAPMIPLPMGMAPPAGNAAAQPAAQHPANTQPAGPVGGGSNPQHNPIQAFGALGNKGQLNGNAAFGAKNSPDSSKIAGAVKTADDMQPYQFGKLVRLKLAQEFAPYSQPGNQTSTSGTLSLNRPGPAAGKAPGQFTPVTSATSLAPPKPQPLSSPPSSPPALQPAQSPLVTTGAAPQQAAPTGLTPNRSAAGTDALMPKQIGGLFGRAGYQDTLSRWYNPNTSQQVTDPREAQNMRIGQGALGVGAGAAAAIPAVAGAAAAAPAVAAAGGTTAAQAGTTAAGALGAAAANPRVQQMLPTFSRYAGNLSQFGHQTALRLSDAQLNTAARFGDMKTQLGKQIQRAVPETAQNLWRAYEHNIGAPIEQAARNLGADAIGHPLNGPTNFANTGNPTNLLPHSLALPYEAAHTVAHPVLHGLEHAMAHSNGFGAGLGSTAHGAEIEH